ncbi:MAG: hypothetical protein LN545_00555 [Candidatus Megaira endosymbiont of Carteria cerasiformis]|nr:hypothetical protein [Candidatus Megaera polyxenophila]MCC8460491.1 hypothetical protein [Candidatus Megaera polyxenophila]
MAKGKEEGKEKEGMAQNFPYITTEGTRCFTRRELTISPEEPVHYRSGVEEETSYSKTTTTPVTTPNKTNYYNWDVIYDSSSGSVRIDIIKSEIVTIPSSGSDSLTTSSSSSSLLCH